MTRATLFRSEAVAAQAASAGGALGLVPIGWSLLILFLTVIVGAAIGFAAVAGYARKEAATGLLVPSKGIVRVVPPRSGVVDALSVQDGQPVAAGAPLFTLGAEHGMAGGRTLDLATLAAIDRQAELMQEQIAAEERQNATERRRLSLSVENLERQIAELEEQRAIQERRASLAADRLGAARELRSRGFVSEASLKEREEAWLSQKQNVTALTQQTSARRNELSEVRHQLEQLPARHAEKVAQIRQQLADNSQKRAEAEARRTQVVQAPVAGRVTALQAVVGQAVEPSKPALSILPEDAELKAELFVASRAIGFVEAGQRVRLLYDAFPFQRFGAYWGRVESVSETVIAPADLAGPMTLREPSYKIVVALERQTVDAFGRQVPLQPNMALTADIILEERSLLEWLFEPVLSARGRM